MSSSSDLSQIIKSIISPFYRKVFPCQTLEKNSSELSYWRSKFEAEGGKFQNSWYQKNMLAMAGEEDDGFLNNKIVADFGCGPRGSLEWARSAKERIGIDVLANAYKENFDLSSHFMRYINNTEYAIPLPSNYVDVLYTVNSIDHVDNFEIMCRELVRILKPGGEFIGSFNLYEPATPCEPQSLDEEFVNKHILKHLIIKSYRMAPKGPQDQIYIYCFENKPVQGKEECFLWVRATKPS